MKKKDVSTGKAVMELKELGASPAQIAEDAGLNITTVEKIIAGEGKWASLKTDSALQQWRQQQTRHHELMARELSTKALQRIEEMLPKSSLSQAAVTFGILQDKARLLAGESTQNIAFGGTVRVESEKLNDMLARLISSLHDDATEAEVVAPVPPGEEPKCATTTESTPGLGLGSTESTG